MKYSNIFCIIELAIALLIAALSGCSAPSNPQWNPEWDRILVPVTWSEDPDGHYVTPDDGYTLIKVP